MGIVAATMLYAFGGGLIEVVVSPTVEALPLGEKSSSMAFLHSFYCWGQVLVVSSFNHRLKDYRNRKLEIYPLNMGDGSGGKLFYVFEVTVY